MALRHPCWNALISRNGLVLCHILIFGLDRSAGTR